MSCKTGDGVESFLQTMKMHFEHLLVVDILIEISDCMHGLTTSLFVTRCGNPLAGNPSLTQARHRQHLASCAESLDKFQGMFQVLIIIQKASHAVSSECYF